MVSIFVGSGAGFARGSGATLGPAGILGSGVQGRSGETVSVNAATGNMLIAQQDEFLVGRGPDVVVGRTYNSLAEATDGDNGDQWQFSSARRVFGLTGTLNTAGSTVRRQGGDGSVVIYSWDTGQSAYIATDGDGAHDRLVKSGASWVWTDGSSRMTETYETSVGDASIFRVKSLADTDGNEVTYRYLTGTDKVEYVVTANHNNPNPVTGTSEVSYVYYEWSGNNIARIVTGYTDYGDPSTEADNVNKQLTRTYYTYDGQNRLIQVTVDLSPGDNSIADGKSYVTTYSYEGSSKRVASITQTDGSSLAITYDASGRVSTLTQTVGVGDTRVTTLTYGPSFTDVTGPDGQVTRLEYDTASQLTKITAPPAYAGATAQTVQFGYDAAGNLTSVTDNAGKVSSYTYDGNGNMLTSTDANGNIVSRTYGATNELLTETRTGSDSSDAAAAHTTRYVYDSENHLRYLITPEGRVAEYAYLATGELYLVTGYTEHDYPVGATAPTEAEMITWRYAVPDRQSTQIASYVYDARGQMTQQVRFGYTAFEGYGLTSEGYSHKYFNYDQAGRLLSSVTATLASETFVYDGMGRLVGSTDLAGGTTTIVFNDAALTTTITSASGYTTVNSYNKAGELVGTTGSGVYDPAASTSYLYDKNGRVRRTVDATGVRAYHLYDKVGRLVADINSYGDLIEYRYDTAGRVAATIRYGNVLTAGQLTSLDDPNNGLEMDDIRPASAAGYDIWSWAIYDDAGRLIQNIAGDGSTSTYSYDGSDRLVKTTSYYNKLSGTQLTAFRAASPTALVLPTADVRDTVSRTFYNRDGRLIGALDGEGYLTEVVYDRAGQKVEEIAYAAKTSSAYWLSGTFDELRASAAPASSANRRAHYVYDGQGLLRFSVDNAGHVTEFEYRTDVAWSAIGRVRSTIAHAVAISTIDFTYDNVKALVAANALNAANRANWSVYDTAGRLAYAIDADGAVTSFTYDVSGNVIKSVAFAAGRATSTLPSEATMDSWRDANISNAANRITRNWYSAGGDMRFSVDPEGYVRRFDYDAEGRIIREVTWVSAVSAGDGTTIAQIDSLTNAAGSWSDVQYTYDLAGRRNSVYDGEGNRTVTFWYGNGIRSMVVEGYDNVDRANWVYGFDGSGRIVSEYRGYDQPEQAVTASQHDGLGNLANVTDARGKVTYYTYDERGLVLTKTDAAGGVTSYEYNAFGEVVKTTDPRGGVTYSYYDDLGRVVKIRDAEDYVTETSYTRFGEVASVTRRYNKTASAVSTTTPPTVTAHVQDATTSFDYDKRGLVTKTTDAEGWFESYGYDAFGNRTSVTAKSKDANKVAGGTTTYAYDRRGLLTSETLPIASYLNDGSVQASTVTNSYAYDARGNRIQMIEAAGLAEARTTNYVYDKANRLIETIGQTFLGMTPHSYIRYDARGNVTSIVDATGARTVYYYDDLDRVVVTINPVGTYSENVYDKNGNVTSARVYGTAVTVPADGGAKEEMPAAPAGLYRETIFTYDNLNRLMTSSVPGTTTGDWSGSSWISSTAAIMTSYEYDAAGNVLKTVDPNGNASFYYYNALGQKRAQIDAGGYITYWSYDAEGNVTGERRYATRFAGTPTTGVIPWVAADGADRVLQYNYDRNGNRTLEMRNDVLVHNGAGGTTLTHVYIQYAYNGLGQVVRKTEATGEFVDYSYDAGGRLMLEGRSGYADHAGNTVTPTLDYYYNGLGNLTRTRHRGAGDSTHRITTYAYDGDKLVMVIDPAGLHQYYWYDIGGRVTADYYVRYLSDGSTEKTQGTLFAYDPLGRVGQQWQAEYVSGSWNDVGPHTATSYNSYGEVASVAIGGVTQQQNAYDAAGRLIATNAGDGIWKHFGYDANGNQTIAITSAGADLSGLTFAAALALVGNENVNATYTQYDARGQAISLTEEQRRLSASAVQTLTTTRSYNAFGDVVSETNAAGAITRYAYNNIGRMIRSEGPTVQITLENGATQWVKPSQDYYYDASGRLVATRDANGSYASGGTSGSGTSKDANSGNLTRLTLLAGTGYNGSQALVTSETHADGGVKQTKYDIHGDARTLIDEVNRTTTQVFDATGRVTQVNHAGGLVDYYAYDGLGQRIKHWNNFLGSGDVETTDYDTQGRVIKTRAFGGDITTTSYSWDAAIAASGMGVTTGGWIQTTSTDADRASASDTIVAAVQKTDLFGRTVSRTDKGGQVYSYTYDIAGRMTGETSLLGGAALKNSAYSYYNSGRISQVVTGDVPAADSNWSRKLSSYEYDGLGNLTRDYLAQERGTYTEGYWQPPESPPGPPYELPEPGDGDWTWIPSSYYVATSQLQDGRATYDAAGRMTRYRDVAQYGGADNVDKAWTYDAADNVRSIITTYRPMQANGSLTIGTTTQTLWYRYDAMNRVVISKGSFTGSAGSGSIARGSVGTDLGYNAAGERISARTGSGSQEVYAHNDAGLVTSVTIGGVTRATTAYDLLGRVTSYGEYNASGTSVHSRYGLVYDARGLVLAEKAATRQGTDWLYSHTVNYYSATGGGATPGAIASSSAQGSSTGALLYYSETKNWKNGSSSPVYGSPGSYSTADLDYADAYQSQSYIWRDGALQNVVTLVNRDGSSSSAYSYDRDGLLTKVAISGGSRPRDIVYATDLGGQILGRGEYDTNHAANDPHSRTWMFGGRQMGQVGNDGTGNVDYATSIANRTNVDGTGAFREGAATASIFADFDANFTALNGDTAGSGRSSYTAAAGDTLQGVAQAVWGDANLWYKLAEANGIGAGGALATGQVLTIPGGVMGTSHSASTFKPYDPAEAIGNTSPNTPKPPKAKNCGVFGMILIAVVAVAVTLVTAGAAAAAAAPALTLGQGITVALGGTAMGLSATTAGLAAFGAIGAVAGAVVSQGVGLATGIQDKFSWKGVALAGVSGAIGGALGNVVKGGGFLAGAARGAAGSAITQGIGVATGLQSKFDFAGVAAAGLSGGIGAELGGKLKPLAGEGASRTWSNVAGHVGVGAATAIANAATRSAISGNSFGDNIIAAIPDVVGNTIGNLIASGVSGGGRGDDGTRESTSGADADSDLVYYTPEERAAMVGGPIETIDPGPSTSSYEFAASEDEGWGDEIVVTGQRRYDDGPDYGSDLLYRPGMFQLQDAVYRPGENDAYLYQVQRGGNPRARIGGNGGPPLNDPMTLQRVFPGLQNAPGGAIIGILDNIFDLTGPASRLTSQLSLDYSKKLISDIKQIDPSYRYDSLGFPQTQQGQTNMINDLLAVRASKLYNATGNTSLLEVETVRFVQGRTDYHYGEGVRLYDAGKLSPRLNRNEAIGNYVDGNVRRDLRGFYNRYGVNISRGQPVQVNNRAYNTSENSSTYTIPDSRVGRIAIDVTMTRKTYTGTPQVRGFFNSDFKPTATVIIRPSQLGKGSTYVIKAPGR